jgi:tetrahydromethanopterin S-methyltransferase subunit G
MATRRNIPHTMKKQDDNQPATRRDVEEIVGEVVGQALQVVADQFEAQNKRIDKLFDKIEKRLDEHDRRFDAIDKRFDRLERKLDGTIARVDSHETRIGLLEKRAT